MTRKERYEEAMLEQHDTRAAFWEQYRQQEDDDAYIRSTTTDEYGNPHVENGPPVPTCVHEVGYEADSP